jgi:hypothetical protein
MLLVIGMMERKAVHRKEDIAVHLTMMFVLRIVRTVEILRIVVVVILVVVLVPTVALGQRPLVISNVAIAVMMELHLRVVVQHLRVPTVQQIHLAVLPVRRDRR